MPVLTTGWAALSPQRTTSRLLIMAALRSSSSIFCATRCNDGDHGGRGLCGLHRLLGRTADVLALDHLLETGLTLFEVLLVEMNG